jgi:hypothetical protein
MKSLESARKWFHPKGSLHGWHKDLPADVRRKRVLEGRDPTSAGRALLALSNVSKDPKTKSVARADAHYFFGWI